MTETPWQPGPARPRLDADTVDVWLVVLAELPDDAPADTPLSAQERERATRFVRDEDRRRWTAARTTLRTLLGAYSGADPHELRFLVGPHGKPALADHGRGEAPRFNLSHSADVALIAVAQDREVGIDVELPRRPVDHVALARRIFSSSEADRLAAIEDPDERERTFLRAWVRLEARVKCSGTGIGGGVRPMTGLPPVVIDLAIAPPAAAALAVERGPVAVRTWRWPPAKR